MLRSPWAQWAVSQPNPGPLVAWTSPFGLFLLCWTEVKTILLVKLCLKVISHEKGEDDSRDADETAVLGLLHSTNLDI